MAAQTAVRLWAPPPPKLPLPKCEALSGPRDPGDAGRAATLWFPLAGSTRMCFDIAFDS